MLRMIGIIVGGFIVAVLCLRFAIAKKFSTGGAPPDAIQKTATSKDGTVIAYEQTGGGATLILISAALTDRDGNRPLARQLASAFTVVNYDRRGRGKSANTQPWSVDREIDDVETLVENTAGPVYIFGSSSGAVLALDAANRLGSKVEKLFLYEPPFIVDNSRVPMPESLLSDIDTALGRNDRSGAVSLFFNKGMGIPMPGVIFMQLLMPAWKDMLNLATTVPYDLMLLSGTQSGNPLPHDRWSHLKAPAMVAVGAKSEAFFHSGAKALVALLPGVTYKSLDDLDHSAVLMAPQVLANSLRRFFGNLG